MSAIVCMFLHMHSYYQLCHSLELITVWVLCLNMAADLVFLGFKIHKLWIDWLTSNLSHVLPHCIFSSVQHEKYTSQLQLSLKALEARAKEKLQFQSSEKTRGPVSNVKLQDRTERKAHSLTGNKLTEHTLNGDDSRKTACLMKQKQTCCSFGTRRERKERG